jgi:hypothetical protein
MIMVQIVTSKGEVNASIIKGFLENAGIKASCARAGGSHGGGVSWIVYVEQEKSEEALKFLKEQKLIS